MTSLRTDLRIFRIQDAITLLELDGYTLRVTTPDEFNRVYLYGDNEIDTISITSFEVEN